MDTDTHVTEPPDTWTYVIFGGACHRFRKLKFVSVASGVGWIGSALEAMDWPGPATRADKPRDYIDRALAGLPEGGVHNVLEGTAAKVYNLN